MELWLQRMGDFHEKQHFAMENFNVILVRCEMGVKMFGPKCQKAHPYAKTSRINCLAYVAVEVFWRYTALRKTQARTAIGNSSRL